MGRKCNMWLKCTVKWSDSCYWWWDKTVKDCSHYSRYFARRWPEGAVLWADEVLMKLFSLSDSEKHPRTDLQQQEHIIVAKLFKRAHVSHMKALYCQPRMSSSVRVRVRARRQMTKMSKKGSYRCSNDFTWPTEFSIRPHMNPRNCASAVWIVFEAFLWANRLHTILLKVYSSHRHLNGLGILFLIYTAAEQGFTVQFRQTTTKSPQSL